MSLNFVWNSNENLRVLLLCGSSIMAIMKWKSVNEKNVLDKAKNEKYKQTWVVGGFQSQEEIFPFALFLYDGTI